MTSPKPARKDPVVGPVDLLARATVSDRRKYGSTRTVVKTAKAVSLGARTGQQRHGLDVGSNVFGGDPSSLIGRMRSGTPAHMVPETAGRIGISNERLYEALRLPGSTIKSRISKGQALAPAEQDRLYRVDRVFGRALQVLEDKEAARRWINQENRALGGESPLSLLDTEAGYELVLDTLARIEYGVYA